VLEVQNLSTRFDVRKGMLGRLVGRVHAVENVSFSLNAGETLSIVGESGCGKSTTGRSILGLAAPTRGRILLDGAELTGASRAEMKRQRQNLQMIFQDPFASLNPRIRIGESIAEPMIVNGIAHKAEARDRVAALLTEVGLSPDMMNRFPHE